MGRSPGQEVELASRRGDAVRTARIALAEYPLAGAVPKEGKARGLRFTTYHGRYTSMPDFSALEPVDRGTTDQFHASQVVNGRQDDYALVFEGYLEVPTTGVYRLAIVSDDGSRLYLDDRLLLDNDGPHPPQEVSGIVRLSAGLHPVRVEYFEATGEAELRVFIEREGSERRAVSAEMLFRDG